MTIELTLPGPPRTKKNSMQKTAHGLIQSAAYRQYESDSVWQISPVVRLRIDKPCNVRCVYYMPTRRVVDLCNLLGATCDILVKSGVLQDDNSRIVVSHDGSRVMYDKDRPRVEITIETEEPE